MSKFISINKMKTLLSPLMHLINRKAESPSWNENDPTSKSYIADRTHWKESKMVDIVPHTEVTFSEYWNSSALPFFDLVRGETYTVIFDGKEYTCVAVDDGFGGEALGNFFLVGEGSDTGEPFFICEENNGEWRGASIPASEATCTLQIIGRRTTVHKLSKEYIPDLGLSPVATSNDYWDLDNRPNIYTDVVRYNVNQSLSTTQKEQARSNIGAGTGNSDFSGSYNDLTDKPNLDSPKDGIALIDQVNGYTYIACMRDGNFVTYCGVKSIEVTTMPTKIEYMAGEYFDPDGMIVTATAYDGTEREIFNYNCQTNYLTEGDTSAEVTYVEASVAHTITVPITVTPFDPATVLVDFEYTDNGDGTYTITSWKGTYNGEASTELIIPNNGYIVV